MLKYWQKYSYKLINAFECFENTFATNLWNLFEIDINIDVLIYKIPEKYKKKQKSKKGI